MTTTRIWRGVRMRDTQAGVDPDAPPRPLTLPAAWDDRAAAALAALAPGEGRTTLPRAADAWIRPVASRAREAGDPELADRLHALLLHRRAAPTLPVWNGTGDTPPGFVINLPAFADAATGFDVAAFTDAVRTAATALRLGDPDAPRYAIGLTDLDGLLAATGLDYDSPAARDVAACLAALLRATADIALAGEQPDLLSRLPSWPAPPARCALPGLAEAAADARQTALLGSAGLPSTAILDPGPADALLGAETGGIAPAFSPVGPNNTLTRAAAARLAARSMMPETALARVLQGEVLLQPAGLAAHQAMHDAVAPYMHAMPTRPVVGARPAQPPLRRELPSRRRGYTQRATIGGHRIYIRTGEYADGSLGELQVTLPREGAALRGMVDSVSAAVSLGLQHGVPLEDYVEAFTLTRFGPSGRVEGDADVGHATSPLDYVFRNLAINYLGACTVPEGIPEPAEPDPLPLLPLDLPTQQRRRTGVHNGSHPGLRLVS
jgi:hypothetical protein